ncbi:MAG: hypothetical protein M8858_08340 [marine benthic group bacterium]|nr:hypothetical protein [Gemmatimonadota bacterium]
MNPRPTRQPARSTFERLSEQLFGAISSWKGEDWSEDKFTTLAQQIFAFQFEYCTPYRNYCSVRGVSPRSVHDWRRIPPVPTEAFRHVELRTTSTPGELRFRTSGTTRGSSLRGTHIVPDPELYRASLRAAFRSFVLEPRGGGLDGSRRQRPAPGAPLLISLVPPFDPADGSSLSWMLDDLIRSVGRPGSRSIASPEGIEWKALFTLCDEVSGPADDAGPAGTPVVLLGTTLAFDAWLDRLVASDMSWRLPAGSLLMDTGGAKGREGLDRDAVFGRLLPRLGLDPSHLVNEFGMTELLSQRYGRGTGRPTLTGPPWLRTLVVDPVSLEPRPDGSEGILCHFDLANLGSVMGVLTEDRGIRIGAGIRLLGRTPGAPPRGCSLATSELLRATETG